jgi:hypothetical protein
MRMKAIRWSELSLAATVFCYSLNFGPMFFESWTSDRIWASHPPDSFYMFLGPYGQQTAHYWRLVSPPATATFVLSLIANWQSRLRKHWLLAAFAVYVVVQASTMVYFVPEQERLVANAGSLAREVLQLRASRWIALNYFRNLAAVLAFFLLLRAILVPKTS